MRLFSARSLASFAALALALYAPTSSAKVFYLSAMKDFAKSERPEIELTYSDAVRPFQVRVLKPRNIEEFLDHQIDVRRAWKMPEVKVNSSKYLIDGYNLTRPEFDWIRAGLSSEVRQAVTETYGGGSYTVSTVSLDPGPKKLIHVPAGFDIVKEFTYIQENVGSKAKFDVPGFEWFSSAYGSGEKIATVLLPQLDAGVYLVQFVQGRTEGQVIVVVNDVQASLEQSDGQALYRVATRSGQPIADASIGVRSLSGAWIARGKTDAKGVAILDIKDERDLVSLIQTPSHGPAVVDSEFLPTTVKAPDVFVVMDRPLYHPTDQLYFKGIAREMSRGTSSILKITDEIEMGLQDSEGAQVATSPSARTSDYGTFWGQVSFTDLATGLFRSVATFDGVSYAGDVRVKEFKKPTLRGEFLNPPTNAKPGETLRVKLKVSRYSGEPVGSVQVRADLQRIRFDGPEWIESAGAGETGSSVNYFFDSTQKEAILPLPITTVENIKVDANGEGTIEIEVPGDLPGPPNFDYKLNLLVSLTDADGNAAGTSISFFESGDPVILQAQASDVLVQKGGKASYSVRTVDPAGNPIPGVSGRIELTRTDVTGKEEKLPELTYKTDDKGRWKADLPTDKLGELEISLFEAGKNDPKKVDSLLVADEADAQPVKQSSELTLLTNRTTFAPGETAKVLAVLPEGWSEKESGVLYTTVAGDLIYKHDAIDVKGRAVWLPVEIKGEYGTSAYLIVTYAHPKTGWIERKVSFRILDVNRVLEVDVKPTLTQAEPGLSQDIEFTVLDREKKPVKAEIAVSVVDEALLALQGEFRPRLIDFFYPLGRLNLASFYSSEFQGYGYGEIVAKLFKSGASWAATKSSVLKQEDTAYWNPSVETSDDGKAKVSFRLPANNTTWRITAIVVDKNGRFGEGRSSFLAKSQTPLYLALPNLMRVGDKGLMRAEAKNHTLESRKFDVEIQLPKEMASKESWKFGGEVGPAKSIERTGEVEALAAGDPKGVEFVSKLTVNGKELAFTTLERLRSGDFETTQVGRRDGDKLNLDFDENAKVEKITLQVSDGFSGVVLNAMDWLVRFPYGCAEQLTSSTVPNIVLSRLLVPSIELENRFKVRETWSTKLMYQLEKAWMKVKRFFGAINPFSGSLRLTDKQERQLIDAEKFGKAGLKQLRELQSKNGGFQWFGGTGTNRAITHVVVFNLLQLEAEDLAEFDFKLEKAVSYLERGDDGSYESTADSDESLMTAYESTRLRQLGLSKVGPALPEVKRHLDAAKSSTDPFQLGLALAVAQGVEEKDRKEIADGKAAVIDVAVKIFKSELEVAGDGNGRTREGYRLFFSPTVSMAFLARSLYLEKKFDSDLEKKFSNYLAAHFGGDRQYVTFELAQTMLLSRWLIEVELQQRSRGSKPELKSLPSGLSLSNAQIEPVLAGWDVSWVQPQGLKGVVSFDAPATPEKQWRLTALTKTPFKDVKARKSSTLSIERKLFVVEKDKVTEVTDSNVKAGDVIYVELSVEGADPSHYYVFETEVPGGTTWIDEDARYSMVAANKTKHILAKRETKSDVLRLYLQPWKTRMTDAGTKFVTGGVFRVENAGEFTAGVGRVRDFYSAEQFAQTDSARLHFDSARR